MKSEHRIGRRQGKRSQRTIGLHMAAGFIRMILVHRAVVVVMVAGVLPMHECVRDSFAAVVNEAAAGHDKPVMQQRQHQEGGRERFTHGHSLTKGVGACRPGNVTKANKE